MWAGSLTGPMAAPGTYKVHLASKSANDSKEFKIIKSPATTASEEDIQRQVEFINQNNKKLSGNTSNDL